MSTEISLQQELQRLVSQRLLKPLFQPIIGLDSPRILGYEALIRGPEDSPLHTPDTLFAVAQQAQMLATLEFACREASCAAFVKLNLPGKLFLNMSPRSFMDRQYRDGVTREILQRLGLGAERVVFELTESQPVDEFDVLRSASTHFKRQGFAVALDDLGAGYAGLRVCGCGVSFARTTSRLIVTLYQVLIGTRSNGSLCAPCWILPIAWVTR